VLVPLFGSQNSEQEKNARFITDKKAGIMLKQIDFTPQSLLSAVMTIYKHLDTYTKRAKKLTAITNPNSAKHFYALVKSLLE
jgi:UDP-N-acetylglucosamine:LPS N-acetylglucosamine transferase